MKISKVLLRWYKSFNANYMGYTDRQRDVLTRPWNILAVEDGELADDPFIEIPIEDDITTLVGANESGKSHLLSAIAKVITGQGIPENGEYSRTDVCHYAALRSKNADLWPNIGLELIPSGQDELEELLRAAGVPSVDRGTDETMPRITIILAPDGEQRAACLYLDAAGPEFPLDENSLGKVRKCLPRLEFIDSGAAIPDRIALVSLLKAYGSKKFKEARLYEFETAQEAANLVAQLTAVSKDKPLPDDRIAKIQDLATRLKSGELKYKSDRALEVLLFDNVLGIKQEAIEYLYSHWKNAIAATSKV